MIKKYLEEIPIPMAGVALGLCALGNLIQNIAPLLRYVCAILGGILLLGVLAKLLLCHERCRCDFHDPIIVSVSATIFMTIMQLSVYLYPLFGEVVVLLWGVAVAAHLLWMIYYTKQFLFRFQLKEIYPTCFITYVGIGVASITSASFHLEVLGKYLLLVGGIGYAIMFLLVTLRYMRYERSDAQKPLFCIYAAPMSLLLSGYLNIMEISLPLVIVMELLAQLLYLIVLIQLPKLMKLSFAPSYAAFTFPFVITAFGLQRVLAIAASMSLSIPHVFDAICYVETGIAVLLVFYTLFRFVHYLSGQWIQLHKAACATSC